MSYRKSQNIGYISPESDIHVSIIVFLHVSFSVCCVNMCAGKRTLFSTHFMGHGL